eukprot:TRINITY_DN49297_c0_g1_i1.p1 TRINITY_DN49297_c0_g1~~TRINITY_DN49297_c0_g1_i1.p1  ORF type:complete len:765 (+),score=81.47 TRINITY_DN49297_c0_g1_i1:23-2317(+)
MWQYLSLLLFLVSFSPIQGIDSLGKGKHGGKSWKVRNVSPQPLIPEGFASVVRGNNLLCAGSQSGQVVSSTNGTNWKSELQIDISNDAIVKVLFVGGHFVVVPFIQAENVTGFQVWTSPTCSNFMKKSIQLPKLGKYSSIQFVAGGENHVAFTRSALLNGTFPEIFQTYLCHINTTVCKLVEVALTVDGVEFNPYTKMFYVWNATRTSEISPTGMKKGKHWHLPPKYGPGPFHFGPYQTSFLHFSENSWYWLGCGGVTLPHSVPTCELHSTKFSRTMAPSLPWEKQQLWDAKNLSIGYFGEFKTPEILAVSPTGQLLICLNGATCDPLYFSADGGKTLTKQVLPAPYPKTAEAPSGIAMWLNNQFLLLSGSLYNLWEPIRTTKFGHPVLGHPPLVLTTNGKEVKVEAELRGPSSFNRMVHIGGHKTLVGFETGTWTPHVTGAKQVTQTNVWVSSNGHTWKQVNTLHGISILGAQSLDTVDKPSSVITLLATKNSYDYTGRPMYLTNPSGQLQPAKFINKGVPRDTNFTDIRVGPNGLHGWRVKNNDNWLWGVSTDGMNWNVNQNLAVRKECRANTTGGVSAYGHATTKIIAIETNDFKDNHFCATSTFNPFPTNFQVCVDPICKNLNSVRSLGSQLIGHRYNTTTQVHTSDGLHWSAVNNGKPVCGANTLYYGPQYEFAMFKTNTTSESYAVSIGSTYPDFRMCVAKVTGGSLGPFTDLPADPDWVSEYHDTIGALHLPGGKTVLVVSDRGVATYTIHNKMEGQ